MIICKGCRHRRKHYAKGTCNVCYQQMLRYGRYNRITGKTVTICRYCDNPRFKNAGWIACYFCYCQLASWAHIQQYRAIGGYPCFSEKSKEILRAGHRRFYYKNKTDYIKKVAEYRKNNKHKVNKWVRHRYERHKTKILKYMKAYRKRNRPRLLELSKKYYQANRYKWLQYAKQYRLLHKQKET